jgi:Fe2+ or Zn2+ uptake regulation protein
MIKTILTCDECKKELILDGPYHIAKTAMKEKGWKNKKIDDEWKIICDKCGGKK